MNNYEQTNENQSLSERNEEVMMYLDKLREEEQKDYYTFAEREVKEIDWLWYPYIVKGNLNIIVGDGGIGKSYFTSWLLSAISNGSKMPFSKYSFKRGYSILQNAEDDPDATILPRLLANGADTNKIGFFNEDKQVFCIQQLERLEERLEEIKPDVVILDPIQAYIGSVNMNAAVEVRNALKPLKILAEKYNCAIILIMHLNKNNDSNKATNRVMGSVDFTSACRSVILVAKNPDDPQEKLFIPIKSNLVKENEKNTLSYKIDDDGKIVWLENKGILDPDEILTQSNKGYDKKSFASGVILGALSRGEMKANEFKDVVINNSGISEKCYNETKARMVKENLIRFHQKNNAFYWKINKEIEE